jgi:hypothetical protein
VVVPFRASSWKNRGASSRAFGPVKLALDREDAFPQPWQELVLSAGDDRILREMRVAIDQPREHRGVRAVIDPAGLRAALGAADIVILADRGDAPALDDQAPLR